MSRSRSKSLNAQLGTAPVTALGIPFDSIVGSHPYPMWQRAILLLLLGQCPLGAKRFLRGLGKQATSR